MPTLADELMGNVPTPKGQGRVHICPDEGDIVPPGSATAKQITEWARFARVPISPWSVAAEFGITSKAAGNHLQKLGRLGVLSRAYMVNNTGGRCMQVWKFNYGSIPQ